MSEYSIKMFQKIKKNNIGNPDGYPARDYTKFLTLPFTTLYNVITQKY